MFHRSSRFAIVVLFLAALMLAGGAVTPVHAAGEAAYLEDVVHAAGIDHITRLVEDALTHLDGLQLEDHDIVYDALGRTNTALDLLYASGATGDVFNTAERLLATQRDLLQEVEHATLTGNLADLSTVAPLLVDYAQARLAFERQSTFAHTGHLPLTSSHLGSSLLHDRSLLGRRSLSLSGFGLSSHGLSTSRHLGRSALTLRRSRLFDPYGSHSLLGRRSLSLSGFGLSSHGLSTRRHLGRSALTLRRSRLFDPFGSRSLLLGRSFSRYGLYR